MSGWIKLHRQIREHWIWDNPDYLKAWLTILLSVNHEDKKVLISGELIDCKIGQSAMSLESWTRLFGHGWTINKTRGFFKMLKNDKIIHTEGLRKTTRLTVCKYADYQINSQAEHKQRTNKAQGDHKQTTTTKEYKEPKEIIYPVGFEKIIEKWIHYKIERRESYKTIGLESFIKKLLELSGNNPAKALKIIEQSMSANWAGIFELKINGTKTITTNDAPIYKELQRR